MGYRVRNEYGELRFNSFDDLRQGYVQQLVGPEDEVLEDGSTHWRKASSMPRLVAAMEQRPSALRREGRWYLLAILLVGAGAYFFVRGFDWVTFAIALVIVAAMLGWTMVSAMRPRR